MMAGICYKKGQERGLWYEIKCIERTIELKEADGEDASFEKKILRAYKKYSEQEYRNGLDSREKSKSVGVK